MSERPPRITTAMGVDGPRSIAADSDVQLAFPPPFGNPIKYFRVRSWSTNIDEEGPSGLVEQSVFLPDQSRPQEEPRSTATNESLNLPLE